jgi:hypothetical protein
MLIVGASASSGLAVAAAAGGGTPTVPTVPPPPTGVTTGPVPHVPTTTESLADQVIILPSAKACVKHIELRLHSPSGIHLRSLRVHVGSKAKVYTHGKPVPSSLTFSKLPSGQFTFTASVGLTTGRALSRSRVYHRCS